MWGPDKYQEETPELKAAIDELRRRVLHLRFPGRALGFLKVFRLDNRVVITTRTDMDVEFDVYVSGWYVDVDNRRAYTEDEGGAAYADPDLLLGTVLPAIRQFMVLDDLADIGPQV
jgi:hypothetical protein